MSDHATRILYKRLDFPILQHRTYASRVEAKACPTGDIHLVEDLDTGLVYNRSFQADLIVYDNNYQNEQAHSPIFRLHLERVANIVSLYLGKNRLIG
jgi:hypothetical protein